MHHYDLIIDIAGNSPLSRLRRALTPTGTAVIVGGESKGNLTGGIGRQLRALILTLFVGQRLTGLASKERASDLEVLADHIAAGTVTPSIDRTYPLDQVPDGHAAPRGRQRPGKDRDHHLKPANGDVPRDGSTGPRAEVPTGKRWCPSPVVSPVRSHHAAPKIDDIQPVSPFHNSTPLTPI